MLQGLVFLLSVRGHYHLRTIITTTPTSLQHDLKLKLEIVIYSETHPLITYLKVEIEEDD